MPYCCAPNCGNGSTKEIRSRGGKPGPSFFRVTKSNIDAWNKAVPRADRKLTLKDYVCSDHFHESHIERFHPDLKIGDLLIKGDPKPRTVKAGAVPSIFQRPSYINLPEKLPRKAPSSRVAPPTPKKRRSLKKDNESEFDGVSEATDAEESGPSSEFIDPSTVKLTKKGWGSHIFDDVQCYTKIEPKTFQTTHMVAVKSDRTILLRVGRRYLNLPGITTAQTPQDIENAIDEIDQLKPCEGNGHGQFSIVRGSCCPSPSMCAKRPVASVLEGF